MIRYMHYGTGDYEQKNGFFFTEGVAKARIVAEAKMRSIKDRVGLSLIANH